ADLAEKIPRGARAVLDVGCSRGATAAALRARGVSRIVGVEPDGDDAADAAGVYDRVLVTHLEDVPPGEFGPEFDAVLFGDVFEACGYRVDVVDTVRLTPSPGGRAKLAILSSWPDASPDLDVAEFLVAATPAGP